MTNRRREADTSKSHVNEQVERGKNSPDNLIVSMANYFAVGAYWNSDNL